MKIPVLVTLDEESIKVWNKIPNQEKSKTVRELLKGLKENKNPKDLTSQISLLTSKNSSEEGKHSNTPESHSYATGHTAQKKPNRKSSAKHKANIYKLLNKA